jgi:hypothetical protein
MNPAEIQHWQAWFSARGLRLEPVPKGYGWRVFDSAEVPAAKRSDSSCEPAGLGFATKLSFSMEETNPSAIGDRSLSSTGQPLRGTEYLAWSPKELPAGNRMCLMSSRIGRNPGKHPWWLEAIRTSCVAAARENATIVMADGISTAPYVGRLSSLMGLGRIEIHRAPRNTTRQWFRTRAEHHIDANCFPLWIIADRSSDTRPPLDCFAATVADQLRVLLVSAGGNVEAILRQFLDSRRDGAHAWLLCDDSGTPRKLSRELVERGAIQWILRREPGETGGEAAGTPVCDKGARRHPPLASLPDDLDDFLAHWTRAPHRIGADRSGCSQIDRLMFGLPGGDHGALCALLAILVSGRLIGSSSLTRDTTPVVSFTGTSLQEFRSRRVFRSHLGRWDFELYGIAIRRASLAKRGARRVIYGAESDWQSLPDSDRPWFQAIGVAQAGKRPVDWRAEREWRVCGDLDLRQFGSDEILVFAPDRDAAIRAAEFSRWPVIVVPGGVPAD